MSKLRLTNSLSNKKEEFIPQDFNNIKMYVCGITPYDYPHLGHGRCYVTFDLLYRILNFLNYKVIYARNFTDVDDKLINRSIKDFGSGEKFLDIANKFIEIFETDMSNLNCHKPTYEPRVTENIKEIIEFIEGLIKNKKAYVVNSGDNQDVYYSIKEFKDYGKLSKRTQEELLAGARVNVREEKRDAMDFALWKSAKNNEVGWQSPWGHGRPGWHIECSAMAKRYLGEQIDIHGGGMDLIFPHHENEVAQSEGLTNLPFARYWVHNAFITVDQEKMSKSLGNFVTLKDALKLYSGQILRFYFLSHHYRIPVDFSDEAIKASAKAYNKICKILENIESIKFDFKEISLSLDTLSLISSTRDERAGEKNNILVYMINFLLDDMNVSGLLGVFFDNQKMISEDKNLAGKVKFIFQNILGLDLIAQKEEQVEITQEIQDLLDQREQARKDKNWALADEIRNNLIELGYQAKDKKI